MRVFAGFQIPTDSSETEFKRVPVVYGNMDRVVASLLNKRETFTNKKLPIMAVNMSSLTKDERRKMPNTHIDEVLNDAKFHERLTGIPFLMEMELAIYADSTVQLFEIVEQILMLFHPRVAIQIDSQFVNNEYLTEITLDGIQPDIQYPMGQSKQIVMMNLNFSMPIVIRYPIGENTNFIETIKRNVFTESESNVPTISDLIMEITP